MAEALRCVAPIWHAWLWLRERLYALKPCRSAIVLVLAGLGVAWAFYRAARGYESDEKEVKALLESYAFWCFMGALAFLAAVWARRRLAQAAYKRLKLEFLNLRHEKEEVYGTLRVRHLSRLTLVLLALAILSAAVLFCLMLFKVQAA